MTKLGTTCATAFVIGRPNAQTGFGHMSSTIGAGNDSDFAHPTSGDSGPDRFYKIYLKVGEQLQVNGNPSPASYDLSYGLYRGENCETPITCVDNDMPMGGRPPMRMETPMGTSVVSVAPAPASAAACGPSSGGPSAPAPALRGRDLPFPPDMNGTTPDTMPYQAVVEGWHVLVVDGRSSAGDYSLVVTLDCQEEDCCCR